MFILFNNVLYNQNTVLQIIPKQQENKETQTTDFVIEMVINGFPPVQELFREKVNRDKRFLSIRESVGCASDR